MSLANKMELTALRKAGLLWYARCQSTICPGVEVRADGAVSELFHGVCNTLSVDSYDSVVHPDGGRFDSFLRNPVMYLEHGWMKDQLPIGVATLLTKNGDGIEVDFKLADDDEQAERAANLVRQGVLRGLSIGFSPDEYDFEMMPGDEKTIMHIRQWTLREISVVGMPSNPDALIKLSDNKAKIVSYPSRLAEAKALSARIVEIIQLGENREGVGEACESVLNNVYGVSRESIEDGEFALQVVANLAMAAETIGGKDRDLIMSLLDACGEFSAAQSSPPLTAVKQ